MNPLYDPAIIDMITGYQSERLVYLKAMENILKELVRFSNMGLGWHRYKLGLNKLYEAFRHYNSLLRDLDHDKRAYWTRFDGFNRLKEELENRPL